MSRIVHLENGSAIHADIVEAFDEAVMADDNLAKGEGTTDFWNFVESDMYLTLSNIYASSYIQEAFETLADQWTTIDTEFYALFNRKVA
jgi:hypothetical protein|tara:strand:+ start:3383 stop:3649 length:267 start_codon:yes stop_codon:yes gene_type:complete